MSAEILDGRALAKEIRATLKNDVAALRARAGISPTLAVLRIGDDDASAGYARAIQKTCDGVGVDFREVDMPFAAQQGEVEEVLNELNTAPEVHGIMILEPVPDHISHAALIDMLNPAKDVDGVHPINAGRLQADRPPYFVPATPAGGIRLLEKAGVAVTRLPALEAFPDSVFIEDPALCLPKGAVVLRPGAESRIGEANELEPALRRQFADVRKLAGPGFVDGGDIMVTGSEVIAGLSARTNRTGYDELAAILKDWSYASRCVETPPGVLHLKTASAILGEDIVLCTLQMAQSGVFDGYRLIETAPGEDAAANAIRVNDTVFVSAGFPQTTARIREALPDVSVVELPTTQAALVDGGLSCMSLRFFQPE